MKFIVLYLITVVSILTFVACDMHSVLAEKRSDEYIRERVILLQNNGYSCSGIQVRTAKNKVYILSAAHCRAMFQDGKAYAIDEDGNTFETQIVDMDVANDLLLLTPINNKSINVASSIHKHEKIHTITHGQAFPSYRTDGELLAERDTLFVRLSKSEPELYKQCLLDPRAVISFEDMLFGTCQYMLRSMISTALVAPGSSGGAVLNAYGELVGIVSNTDGLFSGMVPLHNIQDFLKER